MMKKVNHSVLVVVDKGSIIAAFQKRYLKIAKSYVKLFGGKIYPAVITYEVKDDSKT